MRLQCKDAEFIGMLTIGVEQFPEWRCPNRKCGMMVAEDYRYCPHCGQKIRCTLPPRKELEKYEMGIRISYGVDRRNSICNHVHSCR